MSMLSSLTLLINLDYLFLHILQHYRKAVTYSLPFKENIEEGIIILLVFFYFKLYMQL